MNKIIKLPNYTIDTKPGDSILNFPSSEKIYHISINKNTEYIISYIHKIIIQINEYPGNETLIKEYLDMYPNEINNAIEFNYTPLMLTCLNNVNLNVVKILLSYDNININSQTASGYTALMLAITWDAFSIFKLIISHEKIDVNIYNKNGDTALILAVSKNDISMTKLLLKNENIDINFKNIKKENALSIAMKNNYIDILQLLLAHKNIEKNIEISKPTFVQRIFNIFS